MGCGQTNSALPEMLWARLDYGRARHAQETPKSQHNEAQITLIFSRKPAPVSLDIHLNLKMNLRLIFNFILCFRHKFKFSVFSEKALFLYFEI